MCVCGVFIGSTCFEFVLMGFFLSKSTETCAEPRNVKCAYNFSAFSLLCGLVCLDVQIHYVSVWNLCSTVGEEQVC